MGSREPLATNKLVASEDKIEGVEDKQTLEDWFENVAMKVNLVYPGAKSILDWAASSATEITASEINRRGDSTLATMLSLQMYVFLKCKTKATASNHLKTLSSERGLEGWRILRKELMGVDGPRQEEEFNAIADLPSLKPADMAKFENLYIRWEAELKRHEAINREYFIGKFRKRQIVYKAMPGDVKESIDAEVAKGQLQTYEDFIDFIKSISKSSKYKHMPPPKPLSANLVLDEPSVPDYTHDEWVAYIGTEEGWSAYQCGEDVDTGALREVLSLVGKGGKAKGKGNKGKGWDSSKGQSKGWDSSKGQSKGKGGKAGKGSKGDSKGKGKGVFNGNCHNCGAWGHRIADCPEPRQNQGVRYISEYYQPTADRLAFMVTDHASTNVDYRHPWRTIGELKPSSRSAEIPSRTDITHNKFEALVGDVENHGIGELECAKLLDDSFPIPVPTCNFPKRQKMPKLPQRRSQIDRNISFKSSCDADKMSNKEFMAVIGNFGNGDNGCCNGQCGQSNNITQISPNTDQPVKEFTQESDSAQSNLDVNAELYDKAKMKDMATRMMSNLERRDMRVSTTLDRMAGGEINLITCQQSEGDVLNVEQDMVWVQVPCAVDSGACANVAPTDIFAIASPDAPKLEPKYFAADGSPIAHLGSLVAEGVSDEGTSLKIDFDLGKVTRPLLSVFKMTSAGHKVRFDEHEGSIQIKGSSRKIKLRQEGRLYMLDLWCKVPAKLAASSPFIRQVAKA